MLDLHPGNYTLIEPNTRHTISISRPSPGPTVEQSASKSLASLEYRREGAGQLEFSVFSEEGQIAN